MIILPIDRDPWHSFLATREFWIGLAVGAVLALLIGVAAGAVHL